MAAMLLLSRRGEIRGMIGFLRVLPFVRIAVGRLPRALFLA
jgi:hypothetical protein